LQSYGHLKFSKVCGRSPVVGLSSIFILHTLMSCSSFATLGRNA